jgi:acyl-CoA reductase-like NAD-dependent aldehyde dehydrogenase
MRTETRKLIFGNPLNVKTTISNMIDEENSMRVESWVNEAIKQGAKLIIGGKRKGAYYEPTILSNTNSNMKVNSEEVFGPVICIDKYFDEIENGECWTHMRKYV